MRHTLPLAPETLLYVFEYVLEDNSWDVYPFYDESHPNLLQTALGLASVCGHWRTILLGSGATWARLVDMSHFPKSNHLVKFVSDNMEHKDTPIWRRFHDNTPLSNNPRDMELDIIPLAAGIENRMNTVVRQLLGRLARRGSRLDLDIWHPNQFISSLWEELPGIWKRATHVHLGTMTFENHNVDQVEKMRYRTECAFRLFFRRAIKYQIVADNLSSLRLNGISPSAKELLALLELTPKLQSLSICSAEYWTVQDTPLLRDSPEAQATFKLIEMPYLTLFHVEGNANFAIAAMVLPRLKLPETHACAISMRGVLECEVGETLQPRADFAAFGPALRAVFRRTLMLTNGVEGAENIKLDVLQTQSTWVTELQLRDKPHLFSLRVDAGEYGSTRPEDSAFPNWLTNAIFLPILTEAHMHRCI